MKITNLTVYRSQRFPLTLLHTYNKDTILVCNALRSWVKGHTSTCCNKNIIKHESFSIVLALLWVLLFRIYFYLIFSCTFMTFISLWTTKTGLFLVFPVAFGDLVCFSAPLLWHLRIVAHPSIILMIFLLSFPCPRATTKGLNPTNSEEEKWETVSSPSAWCPLLWL